MPFADIPCLVSIGFKYITPAACTLSGPLVHRVSHRRRGGNGVDGSHVRVGIRYMGGSGIAIHSLLCSRHFSSSIIQNLVPFARGNMPHMGPENPIKALLLVYYNSKFRP